MLTPIIHKLKKVSLWHFVWISVVFSEILTAIMSVILRGRITYDYLITGGVVSLIVASIVIYFVKRLRETEESLKESEKKYRNLVDNAPVGVYTTNPEGDILYVNEALAQMFEFDSPEEMISGGVLAKYKNTVDREVLIKNLKKTGTVNNFEVEVLTKTGKPKNVLLSATLDGDILSGMITDITERKRAEDELKKYSNKLEESNKLKDLFNDIMVHDLLNPATVTMGMAKMALETDEDPHRKEYLQHILQSNEKIIDLIKSANVLATLESGKKLEIEEVDLGVILKSVAKEMTHFSDAKKINIKMNAEGKFKVMTNPLIHTVFINLLSNAIKYGPENSEVIIELEEDGPNWKISITDTGPGIPDKHKEAVFNRFKRVTKGPVKGTGLGLAIVKKVVEAHKGRAWVEDNPDGGSIFYVNLPKK